MASDSRALPISLSATYASLSQRRTALAVSIVLLLMLVATAPFARIRGANLPAFVPIQKTFMLVADLITAVLLFGQYSIERNRELNLLASGYLFTALITVPHALTFPGVFSEGGLLGAGTQSAAWLYIAWHGGLPLVILASALMHRSTLADTAQIAGVGFSIWTALLTAAGAVAAVTLFATAGHEYLPPLIEGGRFTTVSRVLVGALLLLPVGALLTRIGRPSVLDLWLKVVMFAWFCTIAIGAFLSNGRYDVGWYMGLIFDALTSIFVLLILLHETLVLHARQFRGAAVERRERERRLNEMQVILIHLARVNELGQNVSTLIHEISQPLTTIALLARTSLRLAEDSTARLKQLLEALAASASNAMAVITHLRAFIKSNQPEPRIERIPEMIEDAIRLASLGGISAVTIEVRCHPGAVTAFFDRVQIEQVIFNLVRNAIEAMTDQGAGTLTIVTEPTSDSMIQISIADTGPGLPSIVREKLFQPFVTTKAGGLGIGLSICRIIIEEHGGQLRAEDNPTGGTIFKLTIPQLPANTVAGLSVSTRSAQLA